MTAIYTEGFETIGDQSDMLARGMLQTVLYSSGTSGSVAIPSRTGQPGKGLYLRGPYGTATVPPIFQANLADFGLIPLGISAYAAWQAGGFTVGFSASFNAGNYVEVASGGQQQIAYDGSTYYWAIYRNANTGVWGIAYSADLQNWTPTLTLPASGLSQNSQIHVYGSGLTATVLVCSQSRSVGVAAYYTTNQGMSWTAMTMPGTVAYTSETCPVMPSGPSGPLVTVNWPPATGFDLVYYSSLTAAPTRVIQALAPAGAHGDATMMINNGYIIAIASGVTDTSAVPSAGQTYHIAYCATSSDPSVAGNWTVLPAINADITNVVIFGTVVVACGYGGIYYLPLTGAAANTWFASPTFAGAPIFTVFSMANNGTTIVAVGQDNVNPNLSAFYTSTDGIHWAKQNQFIYTNVTNANTAFNAFTGVIWDGSRFIATCGINNGMIVTSPDGLIWECIFVTDYVEQAATNTFSFPGVYSGQLSAAGLFTPWAALTGANIGTDVNAMGITCTTQSSGVRTVYLIMNDGNLSSQGNVTLAANTQIAAQPPILGQQPGTSLTHYYELIFTAGVLQNNFTIQWAIDGQVQPYSSALSLLAANNDAGTMQLYFSLPRHGNFNVIDDVYLTTANGQGSSGRLGPQSIFAVNPNSVVAGAFLNTNGSKTNAQVANEELTNSKDYLYTNAAATQDSYGATNQVPANYVVKSVQVDAFMTSLGTGVGVTGQVGVKSGSTAKAGSTITPPAAGIETRSTLFMETDPNTGAAFTNAALNALDLTVKRIT